MQPHWRQAVVAGGMSLIEVYAAWMETAFAALSDPAEALRKPEVAAMITDAAAAIKKTLTVCGMHYALIRDVYRGALHVLDKVGLYKRRKNATRYEPVEATRARLRAVADGRPEAPGRRRRRAGGCLVLKASEISWRRRGRRRRRRGRGGAGDAFDARDVLRGVADVFPDVFCDRREDVLWLWKPRRARFERRVRHRAVRDDDARRRERRAPGFPGGDRATARGVQAAADVVLARVPGRHVVPRRVYVALRGVRHPDVRRAHLPVHGRRRGDRVHRRLGRGVRHRHVRAGERQDHRPESAVHPDHRRLQGEFRERKADALFGTRAHRARRHAAAGGDERLGARRQGCRALRGRRRRRRRRRRSDAE